VEAYKKAVGDFELQTAIGANDYAKAVTLSKQKLAENPDDVKAAITGAWEAYRGVGMKSAGVSSADALSLAQKALQLLEAGKTADSYLFPSRDEAQAWMEYVVGAVNVNNSNFTDGVPHLVKAAQSNTSAKQEPTTYALLARAYTDEYLKLKAKYDTFKEETDESRII